MVSRNRKLTVFEDFVIDKSLPKHQNKEKVKNESGNDINSIFTTSGNSFGSNMLNADDEIDYAWMHIHERRFSEFNRNPTLSNKLKLFWCRFLARMSKRLLAKELDRDKKIKAVFENTENFFNRVKESLKEIDNPNIPELESFYRSHIEQATELRQIALVEKLKDKLDTIYIEAKLLDTNFNIYVSEEDIIKFNGVYGIKNLYLTWIKNFNRMIPSDVYNLKKEADKLMIFDNYVILHTDATGDVTNETKAERKARVEREKDPILFGVVENSRKLYYIGDWIDEYCDLTLDKVLDKLEKEADTISLTSIKKEISSVNV